MELHSRSAQWRTVIFTQNQASVYQPNVYSAQQAANVRCSQSQSRSVIDRRTGSNFSQRAQLPRVARVALSIKSSPAESGRNSRRLLAFFLLVSLVQPAVCTINALSERINLRPTATSGTFCSVVSFCKKWRDRLANVVSI